ncbi:leucine-rich repeat domain-containing protein [Chaetoceros tenuissimus]|uniref:Leucine-rich repeat domain-containing protein n=1 Tax=Chaetoceros tenuissimus TaxID=426638 RepID=A0AAD3CLL6_9STRA|nr:leucine-rich repeat domain-containing protein [Chaetoceros tenuissimus]
MKLLKYPTQAEWDEIVALGPGVRMFRGKKTLFYNGEKLRFGGFASLIYDEEERNTWQVMIVLPGVEMIPCCTFYDCRNIKTVVMADTVKRIEREAFMQCFGLQFVKLSTNLEFIGERAFCDCGFLTSIFIPPSCREIDWGAFFACKKLLILGLPHNVQLGQDVFQDTELLRVSPFETDEDGEYNEHDEEAVVQWVKSITNEEAYALHHLCCSHDPDEIYRYVKAHGLRAMKLPNKIGITPSQYLAANPYFKIEEGKFLKRYVLEMMGEVVVQEHAQI